MLDLSFSCLKSSDSALKNANPETVQINSRLARKDFSVATSHTQDKMLNNQVETQTLFRFSPRPAHFLSSPYMAPIYWMFCNKWL